MTERNIMVYLQQIKYWIVAGMLLNAMFFVPKAHAITDNQKKAIVQNCSNIKQSLVTLQHADSRTRTYLGSAYEAISGRFITPLNLRLVRNNTPSEELFKIQNRFSAAQADFRNKYIEYMRELEGLIATDCASHPDDFYKKLEVTRRSRSELRKTTQTLSELARTQYVTVESLKGKL